MKTTSVCRTFQLRPKSHTLLGRYFFWASIYFVSAKRLCSICVQMIQIEIYISSESWINMFSIDVWFVRVGKYLAKIQRFKYLKSEGAKKPKYWEISCSNEVLSKEVLTSSKAAVCNFFWLKIIQHQYLSKYITSWCSKLFPILAWFTTVSL